MEIDRVKILRLYPKELNLYGDGGNLLCLIKRLEWRGIKSEIIEIEIGESIPDFDIMLIGGGQDREMNIISNDVRRKGEMLSYAIECGRVILAVCAGFQLLGEHYETADGGYIKLSGALPFHTVGGRKRKIGNIVIASPFGCIAGFENHSGKTYLPPSLSPLGNVISGFGNNGEGGEGLLYKNTFATYMHGAVLPKNPALADELIKRALKTDELKPLDDEAENRCHDCLIKRYS